MVIMGLQVRKGMSVVGWLVEGRGREGDVLSPMVRAPSICIAISGGSHWDVKASTRYLEKERQMMASMAGFRTMIDTQAKRNAGR